MTPRRGFRGHSHGFAAVHTTCAQLTGRMMSPSTRKLLSGVSSEMSPGRERRKGCVSPVTSRTQAGTNLAMPVSMPSTLELSFFEGQGYVALGKSNGPAETQAANVCESSQPVCILPLFKHSHDSPALGISSTSRPSSVRMPPSLPFGLSPAQVILPRTCPGLSCLTLPPPHHLLPIITHYILDP